MARTRKKPFRHLVCWWLLISCCWSCIPRLASANSASATASTAPGVVRSSFSSEEAKAEAEGRRASTISTNNRLSKEDRRGQSPKEMENEGKIRIVFSDVDGTLVHYPPLPDMEDDDFKEKVSDRSLLLLPPSSTGMRGIISAKTLSSCQELRREGCILVLVSGMRTSTLWKRIPFLPRADAYCSEAGGRIFYPVSEEEMKNDINLPRGPTFVVEDYEGSTAEDGAQFGLREDLEWRATMVATTGVDGFIGMEFDSSLRGNRRISVPLSGRDGLLWEFCRKLSSMGIVVDTKGYSTCFRVNRKHQLKPESLALFDGLRSGRIPHPDGLDTTMNLGCIDFYPAKSGKKNCCRYLAKKFCSTDEGDDRRSADGDADANADLLARHAVCLCDDDNDLDMALACNQAFVPGISSESMRETVPDHPGKIVVTGGVNGIEEGTPEATEHALDRVLALVRGDNKDLMSPDDGAEPLTENGTQPSTTEDPTLSTEDAPKQLTDDEVIISPTGETSS